MRLFLEFREPNLHINRFVLAPYRPFHEWNDNIFKAFNPIPTHLMTDWTPMSDWRDLIGTIKSYDPAGDVCDRHVCVSLPCIFFRKPVEGEKKNGKPPLTLLPGATFFVEAFFAPCELMVVDGPEQYDPLRRGYSAQA